MTFTTQTPSAPANCNTVRALGVTARAAAIRAALKAQHGWTSRDVSVRAESFSMGSALRVKIKNPAVSLTAVRVIAREFETVSRCEQTGEVLSGGNTYLDVEYSYEVLAAAG